MRDYNKMQGTGLAAGPNNAGPNKECESLRSAMLPAMVIDFHLLFRIRSSQETTLHMDGNFGFGRLERFPKRLNRGFP